MWPTTGDCAARRDGSARVQRIPSPAGRSAGFPPPGGSSHRGSGRHRQAEEDGRRRGCAGKRRRRRKRGSDAPRRRGHGVSRSPQSRRRLGRELGGRLCCSWRRRNRTPARFTRTVEGETLRWLIRCRKVGPDLLLRDQAGRTHAVSGRPAWRAGRCPKVAAPPRNARGRPGSPGAAPKGDANARTSPALALE